jgi:hypothetical protein
MSTPIAEIPKPEASKFAGDRKLLLVPLFIAMPGIPEDGQKLIDSYWTEVRAQIENLEARLGVIKHIFHEGVHLGGDAGLKVVDQMNPSLGPFIRVLFRSGATLEPTDDRELLAETTDWQRCLSIGLMSENATKIVQDGYEQASKQRYEKIGERIDTQIGDNEVAVLFISQDHRVQFSSDIQVFYVSPPSLDTYKRWADEQIRQATSNAQDSVSGKDTT